MKFLSGRANWKIGLGQFLLTSLGVRLVIELAYIEIYLQGRCQRIKGNT